MLILTLSTACLTPPEDPLSASWRATEHTIVQRAPDRARHVPDDVRVEVEAAAMHEDLAALGDLIKRGEPYMSAGCLALVDLALDRLDENPASSGQVGHNLYLSSCPTRARLRALRLFCLGKPNACLPYLDKIDDGVQDTAFRPAVPALREIALRSSAP